MQTESGAGAGGSQRFRQAVGRAAGNVYVSSFDDDTETTHKNGPKRKQNGTRRARALSACVALEYNENIKTTAATVSTTRLHSRPATSADRKNIKTNRSRKNKQTNKEKKRKGKLNKQRKHKESKKHSNRSKEEDGSEHHYYGGT